MKILINNAILYTSESTNVHKINSVSDCMICDLCKAFSINGHDVTLLAAEEYKPANSEEFPFKIVWFKSWFKKIFIPNKIPLNLDMFKYIKNNEFDMIICSEVFSANTLMAVLTGKKVIVWQEMAFHQKMAKQMASKFWHNFFVKLFYKKVYIIPRTENARKFISKYSNNVSNTIIPHGINMSKFTPEIKKGNHFVVSSQIIARKRIDKIIEQFSDLCNKFSKDYLLYIIGDGDKRKELELLIEENDLTDNIKFTGKLSHKELINYLSTAKAMLVYTEKDNSMISIAESIALATPVVTTSIPDNSDMIEENDLGIVSDNWNWIDLKTIIENNTYYVDNCNNYKHYLDNNFVVESFLNEYFKFKGME